MTKKQIGVIGTGIMGTDIAHLFLLSGYPVSIYDIDEEKVKRAQEKISSKSKEIKEERLQVTTTLDDLASCQFIVEAVPENLELKQQVFQELERVVSPSAILASNTSGISISKIASVCEYPERVIGTHFFNPATKMPLVEVISGEHTVSATLEETLYIIEDIGKTPVRAKDVPGFIVNRIVTPMLNEAMHLLEDEVSTTEEIDEAIKLAMGHPMGPLQLADFIGLDTIYHFMEQTYEETKLAQFKPSDKLKEMVDNGLLGRKSGKGFYDYTGA